MTQGQDEQVWVYEHFRQIVLELNHFIIAHNEVCTAETFPEVSLCLLFVCCVHMCGCGCCYLGVWTVMPQMRAVTLKRVPFSVVPARTCV